jgi:hypothetical protein
VNLISVNKNVIIIDCPSPSLARSSIAPHDAPTTRTIPKKSRTHAGRQWVRRKGFYMFGWAWWLELMLCEGIVVEGQAS